MHLIDLTIRLDLLASKDLDLTIERLALGDLMDELVSIKSFGIWASRMGSSSIGSGIYCI